MTNPKSKLPPPEGSVESAIDRLRFAIDEGEKLVLKGTWYWDTVFRSLRRMHSELVQAHAIQNKQGTAPE